MAYTPHHLLQFGGTLGTPASEIWSCGIRMDAADGGGLDEVAYLTDVAVPALASWMARATTAIASHCKLTFAKFNAINADGLYAEQDTNEYYWPGAGISGGGPATLLPFQCSLVVTFTTNDVSRGPASRGRIYQPAPAVSMLVTGLISSGTAQGVADSAALLLNTLDIGVAGDVMRPHIFSKKDGSHHQIDFCEVDNRVDVQRRRANALNGVYSIKEILY